MSNSATAARPSSRPWPRTASTPSSASPARTTWSSTGTSAKAGIRAITPRHEQGAGYAAEAYARVSGRPGVVVTTSGPGLTNAMTAAATAYAESQPMLLLSPGMPTGTEGRDLGQLHEAKNTSAAMDALVRWSRRVRSADEAAEAVTEAFALVHRAPSAPGARRDPDRRAGADLVRRAAGRRRSPPPHPTPRRVRRAAELLAAADQPMIIAGGGAVDAQAELTALAEALGAPVATTVNGKGAVDETHPLSVGASIRLRALQEAAADSDALLVVGTELGDSDLWEGQIRGRTVIRLDIDPAQLHKNCPADIALQGDAATAVAALLAALPARHSAAATGRRAGAAGAARRVPGTRRRPTPARTPRSTPRSARRCPPTPCWPGTARRSPTSARCTSSTSRRRASSATRPASPPSATACRPGWVRRSRGPGARSRCCSATAR